MMIASLIQIIDQSIAQGEFAINTIAVVFSFIGSKYSIKHGHRFSCEGQKKAKQIIY
ncbi:hypothetical protein AT05_01215 [Schleiferia thermophila str. Yellowstone]|jgi:hypothetical protein|nr:hypothetical protein AT05_01215 [Schleiferia thermophila str. Yellowstone]